MQAFESKLPSAEAAAIARVSSQELSAFLETKAETQELSIKSADGSAHEVTMPVTALRLLVEVLTQLGDGNTVKLVPIHAELTTQEGADMLNISRPTFIKLLDEGLIPHRHTGNRRKVLFVDVRAYQEKLEANRLSSLDKLSELDQKLGLGY
jgi:excisionase family DNA binding protein